MIPAPADMRPDVAWRRTRGGYTRYHRHTTRKNAFCIICKRLGAIKAGDAVLVRASDHCGRICLACEPKAGILVDA